MTLSAFPCARNSTIPRKALCSALYAGRARWRVLRTVVASLFPAARCGDPARVQGAGDLAKRLRPGNRAPHAFVKSAQRSHETKTTSRSGRAKSAANRATKPVPAVAPGSTVTRRCELTSPNLITSTYRPDRRCDPRRMTPAAGAQDAALQECRLSAEVSFEPRLRPQHIQHPTSSYLGPIASHTSRRGDERVARSSRRLTIREVESFRALPCAT
jgi:hypothetical protein